MPNDEVVKCVFRCKACGKMEEHFTRKPMLKKKDYCEECLYKRRKALYVHKRVCVHSQL
jgi:hypothetical protein